MGDSMEGLSELGERRSRVASTSSLAQVRGHTRNRSEAPLLEGDFTDEEEEQEKMENTDVRLQMGEERDSDDQAVKYPGEPLKTLAALVFQLLGMVTTTVALIITNESVPDSETDKPLPDRVLDLVTYWPHGVKVSEWIMVISILIGLTVCLLHSHRSILFRRVFFHAGLMYFYRAITMSVTVLPKPDPKWNCPKHWETHNASMTAGDVWDKLWGIAVGGGISLGETQQFCGDYIFSGHTGCLILAYLVVRDYSPPTYRPLHWFSLLLFISGISALLAGRGHYTIDVVFGYWVMTRIWSSYHALTNHPRDPHLASHWWWHVFQFLEGSVPSGPLPPSYSLPLPVCLRKKLGLGGRLR